MHYEQSVGAWNGARASCRDRQSHRNTMFRYQIILLYCLIFIILSTIVFNLSLNIFKAHTTPLKITPGARRFVDGKLATEALSRIQSSDNFASDIVTENVTLKYILMWTSSKTVPFTYLGTGQKTFIDRRCKFSNCYVTSQRDLLDYTQYDVIAFVATELDFLQRFDLPQKRSAHQKYVFASIESASNYQLCSSNWNNFFNWTWTYKLDSDSRWGYIIVRDAKNRIIGPSKEMHWMKLEDMESVSDGFKKSLQTKTKAAALFVSNCHTKNRRLFFVNKLQDELKNYNLTVDIYGKCDILKCDRDKEEFCNKLIEKDYFFYLAFENSFSEDYVTEKILRALNYNAIPIVYGGANYTRFMPDGIYLDARQLGIFKLAQKMYELIHNIDKYAEYFRWRKYYSFHAKNDVPETDDYCGFCALLNNEEKVKEITIYEDLQKWWDPPNSSMDCLY